MAADDHHLTPSKFLPTVFFYDLSFLCSFIVSHPLYFSYFIFFSPYLFRFIFFILISPLFLTTSLLLLLSIIATTFPLSKLGIIQTLVDKLRSNLNDVEEDREFRDFEDLELYRIVFLGPPLLTVGDGDDKQSAMAEDAVTVTVTEEQRSLERLFEELDRFEASTAAIAMTKNETRHKTDENSFRLESSRSFWSCGSTGDETTAFKTKDDETRSHREETPSRLESSSSFGSCGSIGDETPSFEKSKSTAAIEKKNTATTSVEKLNSTPAIDTKNTETASFEKLKSTAAIETKNTETTSHVQKILQKLEPAARSISGEDQQSVKSSFSRSNSWRLDSCSSFGSYGSSMRKEKEWKRTLACKLFEERNNSEGGEEGMDSLWEAYEDDNSSRRSKNQKKATTMKSKKKSEFKYFDNGEEDDEDEEEDDEDEFMSNGQVCCLKALKLSTGKMNLGMGKPNLVKITKALKGFGWLHHVGSKHGKKN